MYNKDFCGTVMPSKKDKMVEFSQYIKSDKMPYSIYADIESLINKIDGCTNNPKNSSTTKIGEYIPCGYSVSTVWALYYIENKHTLYHEENCMKGFCTSLREMQKI